MTDQINEFTGARDLWSEPTPAPTGAQQLADHIQQTYRNRHQMLAEHPNLTEVATRLGQEGKLDMSTGQAGIDAFTDLVAAELSKPEANGPTGMLADLVEWQTKSGFY